jgi:hypothetical protein
LEIPNDINCKINDNIINNKIIGKREKSDNDSESNDDDNLKPRFKEYKIDNNELNQSVIGKNAITFLKKK